MVFQYESNCKKNSQRLNDQIQVQTSPFFLFVLEDNNQSTDNSGRSIVSECRLGK